MGIERFQGDFSSEGACKRTARAIASGEPVAVDNDSVFAIWGDAANPAFSAAVTAIKGAERSGPLALTLPAEELLPFIDCGRLAPEHRALFVDSQTFTDHFGAVAFLRLPGRKDVFDEEQAVRDAALSYDTEGQPVIQNWSPEGKTNIERLLRLSGLHYPGVTSLNTSKLEEITEPQGAVRFTSAHSLSLLLDGQAQRLSRGSFPILELNTNGMILLRARRRGIGAELLRRILVDYPLNISEAPSASRGLRAAGLERLSGPELRQGILQYLGWTAVSVANL